MEPGPKKQIPIYDYFNRPPFSRINKDHDEQAQNQLDETLFEWTEDNARKFLSEQSFENGDDGPEVLSEQLLKGGDDGGISSEQLLQDRESTPPVSFNESIHSSQRIVKGGKEMVKSSDDEDSDSVSSLEAVFFPTKLKKPAQDDPKGPKTAFWSAPKMLTKLSTPKYRNSLDSLVHAALDDNETEAKVAELKSTWDKERLELEKDGVQKNRETMLISALGDNENDGELQRLRDALRRTEALDHDRTWSFLDESPITPAAPKFPVNLLDQRLYTSILRDPASRARTFQSGILEFASPIARLPDELIIWIFRSVSIEPLKELRQAYCRILAQLPSVHLRSLIRPYDIIDLFRHLGAKSSALDLSQPIIQDPPEQLHQVSRPKDRSILLSTFQLLRDLAESLSPDTLETAIQILFRMTLDVSLTEDSVIGSELQSCLSGLLESVPDNECENIERRICTTAYETIKDAEFQSRLLQNILPTATWISLLRFRLAVSFLLRSPSPLTESPEQVLDLRRLTLFLVEDDRFNSSLSMAKRAGYDYGELAALAKLLEVVVNTSLLDLNYRQENAEAEFNSVVDMFVFQVKRLFGSIEDSGASNLKRYVAKEALDALQARVLYSVRTKPPPPRGIFETAEKKDRKITSMLFKDKWQPTNSDGTNIPIRGHDQ
ncbi:hypothetical protein N7495_007464 [Penicillium taxi]|uniref:uncharacterized protein n=1 Tax=Penicillium taxi TaxID=168475 RepID=UPI0025457B64|nr:uncharacterized protein N7495_007464 [Penicillium taxi]KAJ5887423.1 hypothetical protein N7495_007464 [Penicillium taxi]